MLLGNNNSMLILIYKNLISNKETYNKKSILFT